jgi:hypothetical protein
MLDAIKMEYDKEEKIHLQDVVMGGQVNANPE